MGDVVSDFERTQQQFTKHSNTSNQNLNNINNNFTGKNKVLVTLIKYNWLCCKGLNCKLEGRILSIDNNIVLLNKTFRLCIL